MTRPGLRVERHRSLPSTNARALELAKAGAEAGWVVVAETQTAGRGQRGAPWASPPGGNLYASFLVRPHLDLERAGFLTLCAGLAVHDAIDGFLPGAVGLKWPNDLLARPGALAGAKVAGILVEAALEGEALRHAVIGVGIDVQAAPPVTDRRTACLADLGPAPGLEALLDALGATLGRELGALAVAGPEPVVRGWTERAIGLGGGAEIAAGGPPVRGRFLGLDPAGSARLAIEGGEIRAFRHGRLRLAVEGLPP
jgi:BirA family biotin operon repressor/biotin-[acetyl-CoA-carboxylase] ligase